MTIELMQVNDPASMELFLDVPSRVLAGHQHHVEDIKSEARRFFDQDNPFWRRTGTALYVVKKHDLPVGRIAWFMDMAYHEHANEQVGYFGYCDAVNQKDVWQALMEKAESDLQARGMRTIRGPINGTIGNQVGILTSGFHLDPQPLMAYNPIHYLHQIEQLGYRKCRDLHAYHIRLDSPRAIEAASFHPSADVTTRPFDRHRMDEELELLRVLINKGMEHHWQSRPWGKEEFFYLIKEMKMLYFPQMVQFALVHGEYAGVIISYPNINMLLKKYDGRMGIRQRMDFLLRLHKIKEAKVELICVSPEYRGHGVGKALLAAVMRHLIAAGYRELEYSWVVEDNEASKHLAMSFGGVPYKRYRVLEKALNRMT